MSIIVKTAATKEGIPDGLFEVARSEWDAIRNAIDDKHSASVLVKYASGGYHDIDPQTVAQLVQTATVVRGNPTLEIINFVREVGNDEPLDYIREWVFNTNSLVFILARSNMARTTEAIGDPWHGEVKAYASIRDAQEALVCPYTAIYAIEITPASRPAASQARDQHPTPQEDKLDKLDKKEHHGITDGRLFFVHMLFADKHGYREKYATRTIRDIAVAKCEDCAKLRASGASSHTGTEGAFYKAVGNFIWRTSLTEKQKQKVHKDFMTWGSSEYA